MHPTSHARRNLYLLSHPTSASRCHCPLRRNARLGREEGVAGVVALSGLHGTAIEFVKDVRFDGGAAWL